MQKKEAKKVEEKQKLVATMMAVKHGVWPFSHTHYHVTVVETRASFPNDQIEDGAEKAARMGRKIGINVKLLGVQEVEIATKEVMKKAVENFLSDNK